MKYSSNEENHNELSQQTITEDEDHSFSAKKDLYDNNPGNL
jgi:hypothetical protein